MSDHLVFWMLHNLRPFADPGELHFTKFLDARRRMRVQKQLRKQARRCR